jgi:hypothetical protein
MDQIYAYPHIPLDSREPYDYEGICHRSTFVSGDFDEETGQQIIFPFHRRDSQDVLDDTQSQAIEDGLSLAARLLRHTNIIGKMPFILVERFERIDSKFDPNEPGIIRIGHEHVQTAGRAFYKSEGPLATPEDEVTYLRHTFQMGIMLAHAMFQSILMANLKAEGADGKVDIDIKEKAWEWEKDLLGGWISGRDLAFGFSNEGQWPGRIISIILRAPKEGQEGYYPLDDHKIIRVVEGLSGWQEFLRTDDTTNVWISEVIEFLLRHPGPPSSSKWGGYRRQPTKVVNAAGQVSYITPRSCGTRH